MFWKLVRALVLWLVVAIVLELVGKALTSGGDTSGFGGFLRENNVLIGFLCGVVYFFFGDERLFPVR